MPFLDGERGRFYYRHWDVEAPRAQVLLLHGFGEHTGHYHRLAGQLNAVGLDVWGPDHIGHGHTGGSSGMFGSVGDLVSNAAVLLDAMAARRLPVVIVGHSLGAVTGAMLALEKPASAKGLVMTGAPLWGLPELGQQDLVMSADEAYLDALANDPLGFDTAPAEPNLWRALEPAGYDVRRALPALDMPVLLINGEHDVFASPAKAAEFAAQLRRGRSMSIRGGHHDIPNDVPHRRVAALIADACLDAVGEKPAEFDENAAPAP
ncbi:alpha/beta hydrolase [Mycobacterium aquaticum]|uniref:Alpha/beta hydrolase n=1 Tax=Mycobacterium aquaticum TaxID=1927124 RepID=A0A1X0AUY0_9MYCO|nr:alpha/beta fold hydrolase [Mycobacterium aquaticum]ORA33668.1 alpha/beta hydrolase [Mycobacterium aquaticum]